MEMIGNGKVRVSVEPTGFVGAAPGRAEDGDEELIAIGFGQSLDDVDFFGLGICDALELSASLDRALTSIRDGRLP